MPPRLLFVTSAPNPEPFFDAIHMIPQFVRRHHRSKSPNRLSSIDPEVCPTCFIEPNDGRVVFSGRWEANAPMYGNTRFTTSPNASVSLRFNGSRVAVFGTVASIAFPSNNTTTRPDNPNTNLGGGGTNNTNNVPLEPERATTARYTIDGREPVESAIPITDSYIPDQPFFSAGSLGPNEHQLTIQVLDVGPDKPYMLQHFYVISQELIPPSGRGGKGGGSNPSTPPRTSPTPREGDIGNDGALVESRFVPNRTETVLISVFGSLMLLLAVGLAVFYVRRRRIADRKSSKVFSRFWRYAPGPKKSTRRVTIVEPVFTKTEV
ncbi:hypothetical protein FA15DRAFT_121719 [Coprinopsis marcescibilis]|uniref:Uncharacterized protein n=1 Tax=Coprinopsis marcescibilis TaxID=230819 RepID=A0A5C3KXA4_COPMA|nr:hypothetical protein FA15DRAFT_121719 [Coprinopsis marcescibilis]